MFLLNKDFLFFILFLSEQSFIFCSQAEIKFYLNNVPSLFRCKKNGPLFYFDRFPKDDAFYEKIIENNLSCNLSLSSRNQRAVVEIDRLDLLCEIINGKRHANEFLFFSSKCSKDSCKRSIPSTATILTEYQTGKIHIERINLFFYGSHSNEFMIGKLKSDIYLVRRSKRLS